MEPARAAPPRVLVSGATGLVGRSLCARLAASGADVARLTRRPAAPGDVGWDPEADRLDPADLEGRDAVVHLAGESLARRWTGSARRRIVDSRVRGTRLLAGALARCARPPAVLVSASAVGYYGDRGDEPLDESSPPGSGFLADVARAWEEATGAAAAAGLRVVHARIGLVLAPRGGALEPMRRTFALGLGGRFGSGRQWMSWIALEDLVEALRFALQRGACSGPVNLTAPRPVTNREFARTLGRVLARPAFLPAPAFALRLLLGREFADRMLLGGQRVLPAALERHGFGFRHPDLEGALRATLGRAARAA